MRRLRLFLLAFAAVPCGCGGKPPAAPSRPAASFELRQVSVERYRAGRLVLSARAERLAAEDLGGTWRAEGVQARISGEEK